MLSDDIYKMIQTAFTEGSFNKELAESMIVLILKEESPASFKQLWPISLCNVIYKLITEVLINKVRLHLDGMIVPL